MKLLNFSSKIKRTNTFTAFSFSWSTNINCFNWSARCPDIKIHKISWIAILVKREASQTFPFSLKSLLSSPELAHIVVSVQFFLYRSSQPVLFRSLGSRAMNSKRKNGIAFSPIFAATQFLSYAFFCISRSTARGRRQRNHDLLRSSMENNYTDFSFCVPNISRIFTFCPWPIRRSLLRKVLLQTTTPCCITRLMWLF